MLGPRKKPKLDRVQVEVLINVAIELDEGMKVHRRALDELAEGVVSEATRDQLIVQGRQAAMVCRTAWNLTDRLTTLPDELQPFGAIRALQRLAVAMVALTQDPPDTAAALTPEELDGALFEEGVAAWLEFQLELVDS